MQLSSIPSDHVVLATESSNKVTRVTEPNQDLQPVIIKQPVVRILQDSKSSLPELDVHARFNFISDLIH